MIPCTCSLASEIIFCFSFGIMISPNENESPPWKANLYPIDLISSKNSAVRGILVAFNTSPMISLRDFFVNTVFIKPASIGTTSLNNTRPTVVSINFVTIFPFSSKSLVRTLIEAFKCTFFSL